MTTKRRRIPRVVTSLLVVGLALALMSCAKDENEKLIKASKEGRLEEVTRLLNSGADVNGRDKEGDTALMGASFWGHLDVVKLLLEKGASVNAKIKDGQTPLMAATDQGNLEVTKLLLERGADVNAMDEEGGTALMCKTRRAGQLCGTLPEMVIQNWSNCFWKGALTPM
jgi:ankyrin repeat protein